MPKRVAPRAGSMQVWPRKRARRSYARVRGWNQSEKGLLAFPCYKAGMTHVIATDAGKHSETKGESIMIPATILECPPARIYSVRCYKETVYGRKLVTEVVVGRTRGLGRKVRTKKTSEARMGSLKPEEYDDLTVTIFTQPSQTGIGQKRPELFEASLGGTTREQLAWIKERAGKEISVGEVFKEGEYVDAHGITKGKGYQGAVKRFGISLKMHKTEKGRRTPGSLGGWKAQQHFMYRVAHAGQTGYHQRTQYNNLILKRGDDPSEVNPRGGLIRYGLLKNPYLLVKGSLQGAKKRLIILTKPVRLYQKEALPTIETVSTASPQGR